MISDKPLLNVDAVAEMFGVSTRHVRRLLDRGEFPEPIYLGGCVRWLRSDLEKWIGNGCPRVCAEAKK